MLEVPDWGLAYWSYLHIVTCLWYTHVLNFRFILILNLQRISMSFKSWLGALLGAWGSWLGFGILILIWIWSLVFDTPVFQISALYIDFEGAKNIHVFEVLIWGFWGCWRILNGVWHHVLDLDISTSLWYTIVPNFDSLCWFWRCKEHLCPLSPDLWLWWMLEAPDWGLGWWSWFKWGD